MKYEKSATVSGSWIKKDGLVNGTKAKIVSETTPQPSSFLDDKGNPKTQDVAKLRINGESEPVNVSLNRATINALVEAFGEDSASWQGHELSIETEKTRVAGKAVIALYLIPEGFEKTDDDNGYAVISKVGGKEEISQEITAEDLPF